MFKIEVIDTFLGPASWRSRRVIVSPAIRDTLEDWFGWYQAPTTSPAPDTYNLFCINNVRLSEKRDY